MLGDFWKWLIQRWLIAAYNEGWEEAHRLFWRPPTDNETRLRRLDDIGRYYTGSPLNEERLRKIFQEHQRFSSAIRDAVSGLEGSPLRAPQEET